MSSAMALRAASLISSGAAKSGNPWDRLTAPCCKARRVISRITDSVNCSAFAESMRREICAIERSGAVIAPSYEEEIIKGEIVSAESPAVGVHLTRKYYCNRTICQRAWPVEACVATLGCP